MDYQYSIIVPHYNIPSLLRRCLWSIPNREDTQIIVVDDKSSEDNLIKLKSLESDFPYVTFIYSEKNGGGGQARNIGLKYAMGKYILFADADDYFNYCIFDVLEKYKYETCDMVIFNATYVDTDTYLRTKRIPALNNYMRLYEKDKNDFVFRYVFGEPWCKLIKRDLIHSHHVKFEEIPIHNDTKFSYTIGYYSRKVKVDNIALYTLADRPNSVSKSTSVDKLLMRVGVFAQKNKFLADNNIEYFDETMLSSFDSFFFRGDFVNLNKCYDVAYKYGFSKKYINKKILNFEIKRVFRKVLSLLFKHDAR